VLSFGLKILWWKKHWQTKFRQWCQFRMITSGKSHSFILGSMWQLSISWNCENNNLLPFLELRQITMNCYIIFCLLSLVIVVFHLSAFMRFFSLFLLRVFRTSLLLCWKVIFSLKKWWRQSQICVFQKVSQCHWWLWWPLPVWFNMQKVGLAWWVRKYIL